MSRKTFQADEHPTLDLLGSSSFTSRSDNWGENVERNHASFLFEKRNGIEVVPYQDVEDLHELRVFGLDVLLQVDVEHGLEVTVLTP